VSVLFTIGIQTRAKFVSAVTVHSLFLTWYASSNRAVVCVCKLYR